MYTSGRPSATLSSPADTGEMLGRQRDNWYHNILHLPRRARPPQTELWFEQPTLEETGGSNKILPVIKEL